MQLLKERYIIKRNGQKEKFDVSKIIKWEKWAANGYEDIDLKSITLKVLEDLPETFTTQDIQLKIIEECKNKKSFNYMMVAGRLYAAFMRKRIFNLEKYNAPTFKGVIKERKKNAYLDKRKLLAKVIWCEDRRSEKAMRMVFSVIYHRSQKKTLDDLYQVAVKPKQFSCLNDPNILLSQRRNKLDIKMEKVALQIVDEFLSGKFKPVIQATHYYQRELIKKPNWAKGKKVVAQYKGHVFLD